MWKFSPFSLLSLHPHQTPTEPESAGSERPPAAQIAARTTTEREGREDRQRQRRTRTSRSPFPFLRARPAGRQIGRETSSSVGARRSPGRGLACSKQQTQTTTTNNNSIRGRRWSSSERPRPIPCKMFELLSDVELMDFPPLSPDSSSYLQGE